MSEAKSTNPVRRGMQRPTNSKAFRAFDGFHASGRARQDAADLSGGTTCRQLSLLTVVEKPRWRGLVGDLGTKKSWLRFFSGGVGGWGIACGVMVF